MAGRGSKAKTDVSLWKIPAIVLAVVVLGLLAAWIFNESSRFRGLSYEREATQSIRDLMDAQNTYYDRNRKYAADVGSLEKAGLFRKNPDVDLVMAVVDNGSAFYIAARHKRGGRVRCADNGTNNKTLWSDDPMSLCRRPSLVDRLGQGE